MGTVVILGAGELGGAVAHALAVRDRARRVLLIDPAGTVAEGKALDIRQSAPVDGFHMVVEGTSDSTRAAGADVCVIADRFERGAGEWRGDDAFLMLTRLAPFIGSAPIVFAGASQAELLLRSARDAGIARGRLIGSATEALASALVAIVAVEARCSHGEVALTVLGAPGGGFVVPWGEASIGGYALDRVLTQVQLTRIQARLAHLWPPGPYALGAAAARTVEGVLHGSRGSYAVITPLGGEFGVRNRVGILPALLGPQGIVRTRVPSLSPREQVQLATALGA